VYSGTYGTGGALLMAGLRSFHDGNNDAGSWSTNSVTETKGELTRNQQKGGLGGKDNGQNINQGSHAPINPPSNKITEIDPIAIRQPLDMTSSTTHSP